mgnify:CR=1 FL=1
MKNKQHINTPNSNLNNIRAKIKISKKVGLGLIFLYGAWTFLIRDSYIFDIPRPCDFMSWAHCGSSFLDPSIGWLFFLVSIFLLILLIIFLYQIEKSLLTSEYRIWKIVILSILLVGIATLSFFIPKSIHDSFGCDFGRDVNCLVENAPKNNDISVCENYKGNIGECYLIVAEKGTDMSICDKIDDLRRTSGVVGGDYECHAAVAFNSKNPLLCNGSGGKSASDINQCYLKLSHKWKDVSLCDNFIKTAMVNDSICTIGNKDSKDRECEKFESTVVEKIECISSISINNNDKNLCKKLDFPQQKFCENRFDRNNQKPNYYDL